MRGMGRDPPVARDGRRGRRASGVVGSSRRRGSWGPSWVPGLEIEEEKSDGERCLRLLCARWRAIYWQIGGQITLISDMPIRAAGACRSRATCILLLALFNTVFLQPL